MGYFSNGTEGLMYLEKYCYSCTHWDEEAACPIWMLHEMYVGDPEWQPTLDRLIPIKGKVFNDRCVQYVKDDTPAEPPLRPGQVVGLKEWKGGARP